MTLPNGETIRPTEGFQLVATTNEDPSILPEALADRFLIRHITEPHPGAIMSLPEPLRDLAWETGRATDGRRISVRRFHQLVRLVNADVCDTMQAVRIVLGDKRGQRLMDTLNVPSKDGNPITRWANSR